MRSDAGLTLAEMMVVLAIIGVMTGVAALGVGAVDRTVSPEIEARRLAARLTLAADQATVDRRVRQFRWDRDGWSLGEGDDARHDLPAGLALEVQAAGDALPVMPDGVAPPFTAEVSGGLSRWRVEFDGLRAQAAPAGASS